MGTESPSASRHSTKSCQIDPSLLIYGWTFTLQGAAGYCPTILLLKSAKMGICVPSIGVIREICTRNRPVSETKFLDDFSPGPFVLLLKGMTIDPVSTPDLYLHPLNQGGGGVERGEKTPTPENSALVKKNGPFYKRADFVLTKDQNGLTTDIFVVKCTRRVL